MSGYVIRRHYSGSARLGCLSLRSSEAFAPGVLKYFHAPGSTFVGARKFVLETPGKENRLGDVDGSLAFAGAKAMPGGGADIRAC